MKLSTLNGPRSRPRYGSPAGAGVMRASRATREASSSALVRSARSGARGDLPLPPAPPSGACEPEAEGDGPADMARMRADDPARSGSLTPLAGRGALLGGRMPCPGVRGGSDLGRRPDSGFAALLRPESAVFAALAALA